MISYQFVFGVPKSGTTWLQKLLDCHPNIVCKGESGIHFFGGGLGRLAKEYNKFLADNAQRIFGEDFFPPLHRDEFRGLMRCFVEQRLRLGLDLADIRSIGNKDPDHGSRLAVMGDLFPEALFIHLVRDGRDCTVSYWHHVRRTYHGKFRHADDFPAFALTNAVSWSRYIRQARQDAERLGLRYLEVRYEDLKTAPQRELQRIFAAIGVKGGREIMDACLAGTAFERLSGRKTGQEDNTAFYRKGVVGDWRNYFDDALADDFIGRTQGLSAELGFTCPPSR